MSIKLYWLLRGVQISPSLKLKPRHLWFIIECLGTWFEAIESSKKARDRAARTLYLGLQSQGAQVPSLNTSLLQLRRGLERKIEIISLFCQALGTALNTHLEGQLFLL